MALYYVFFFLCIYSTKHTFQGDILGLQLDFSADSCLSYINPNSEYLRHGSLLFKLCFQLQVWEALKSVFTSELCIPIQFQY